MDDILFCELIKHRRHLFVEFRGFVFLGGGAQLLHQGAGSFVLIAVTHPLLFICAVSFLC